MGIETYEMKHMRLKLVKLREIGLFSLKKKNLRIGI